jgi:hypothetical protein
MIEINSIAKMNTSSSSSFGTTSSPSSKPAHTHNKNKNAIDDTVTINEKVYLTKNQYAVSNIICNAYEKSVSEYMGEALVQTMETDIEDGNFCDVLLDRLDEADKDDKKNKNNSPSPPVSNTINSDLDMLNKLQTK